MREEYNILKNKFGLPDFEELDKFFEIRGIDKEDDILREISKKILNSVDNYLDILEDMVQPDSRYYTLKEANFLGKSERSIINAIYSKLMYFNRAGIILNLDYSSDRCAKLINDFYKEWSLMSKELIPVINLLKESWSKKTEARQDRGYFG